ncbi:hypothetical protein BJ912DRAFT_930248 [Pholiota molesta]|nr:hypothetical protein BJ912DRAFT_930248 [Pholiota molesta]
MNSRPPPPQGQYIATDSKVSANANDIPIGAPPSYAFVTRMYRSNLRPVVLIAAFFAALWTLFSGIGFFRNASIYSENDKTKLHLFSIILGALTFGVMAIEIFGLYAAGTQKVALVRAYAYLSALVFLIVVAIGLIRTVIHFSSKSDLISICAQFATGQTLVYTGFFGPVHETDTLTPDEAQSWCQAQWDRSSWSEVVSFLITSVLAAFFVAIAFSYLRQVLDPTSAANASREPQRTGAGNFNYPSPYNPPYGGAPGYYPAYPAPAGPPPGADAFVAPPYDPEGKPPGYIRGEDYKGADGDAKKGGYGWAGEDEVHGEGPSERDVTSRAGANPFM